MPELAEVEYYRKQWNPGVLQEIQLVHLNGDRRIFRNGNPAGLAQHLPGTLLVSSHASGKWMLFYFKPSSWLGVHLGMTGSLHIGPPDYQAQKHDHLILYQQRQSLIFSDPRLFGRILFYQGKGPPLWWQQLPPPLLSTEVTIQEISFFLKKRGRSPIKAVLLMQERFPGIGNWMADEILWRSGIHPARPAGGLSTLETKELWKQTRRVVKDALRVIGETWSTPPDTWLFNHRWSDGGLCPKTGVVLKRETIGGRTTCWSPSRQILLPTPRIAAKKRL
jgi:formamidopyrimidine-DNA glycosylase